MYILTLFRIILAVLLIFIITLLITMCAVAERPNLEEVTDLDIRIRFFGAQAPGDALWIIPIIADIQYSTEPTTTHHKKHAKVGPQRWEFDLQKNQAAGSHEKCIVDIIVNPDQVPVGFRYMQFSSRVRVVDPDTGDVQIFDWGDPNGVTLVGKPGKPWLINNE